MPQDTNLNISPYFDDFDKAKNFYRVLFRPGYPIQARELTTLQSILQNQIENIGQHFFKEGAMVIPGQVGYDLNVSVILLQQNFLGVNVETYRDQLTGKIIKGLTTDIRAKVLYSIPATESSRGYISLYVKYLDSADNYSSTSNKKFVDNEQLIAETEITFGNTLIEIGSPFAQMLPTKSSAIGSVAYINAGVYFIRGHFVDVPSSYLILDQYTNNPSYRIGLEVSESIITPEDDPSLNDNAIGSSNYSAPGSHRFRIKTSLVKKALNDDTDKNFIELLRLNNSKVEQFVNKTEYSELEKALARRTYETSGDYVVKPFQINLREHLDDFFNNGVYPRGTVSPDGVTASEDYAAIEVSPGIAYVQGYRMDLLTPKYVSIPKPRTSESVQNGIIPFELGQFVKVYNVFGWPNLTGSGVANAYQTLELRDNWNSVRGSTAGSVIGKARAIQLMQQNTEYNLYLMDIQMYTVLNLGSSVQVSAGDLIVGRTSGARGFIDSSSTGTTIKLIEVSGKFVNNEIIERDGRVLAEVRANFGYEFTDTKQVVGRNALSQITFSANLSLNGAYPMVGQSFKIDKTTNNRIEGFLSKFENDLRPGDVLAVSASNSSGNNTIRVELVNQNAIQITSQNQYGGTDPIFDYLVQHADLDVAKTIGTVADGSYNSVVRLRPILFTKVDDSGDLTIDMPKEAIRAIDDESFVTMQQFANKTVIAGGITLSLPENQQFAALNSENYVLTITSETGSVWDVGDNLDIDNLNTLGTLTVSFGATRQSITISGLTNVNTVTLTAAVSKNVVTKKIKTASKMRVLKAVRTQSNNDVQKFGLAYGNLYGTRIEDPEISLGVNDAYKLHAVYESLDDNDPKIPYVTLADTVFFATGTVIVGSKSGARARVISFNASDLKLYNVSLNSIPFLPGEEITGEAADTSSLTALIEDTETSIELGSKNITNQFYLDSNQNSYFYDVSKLVRRRGITPPRRKISVVFDYFLHEASGDYFSNQSYTGVKFSEIPNIPVGNSTKRTRDVIDFRPAVGELASGSGTVGSPFIVTCATLDFNSRVFSTAGGAGASTIFDLMKVEEEFRCDYSYYLPRIDQLYINSEGNLVVALGKPEEQKQLPSKIENAMLLATLSYAAYLDDVVNDVAILREKNRRYTMRDIGDIDKRLGNVEYYTSLSLLEMKTQNTSIKDEDGFDRLKNGFIVDDFSDQGIADIQNQDYKASIDFTTNILRPSHYTTNVALAFNDQQSSNIQKTDQLITLPYTDLRIIEQPYASRQENVNPFNVFTYLGRIDLVPSSDDWIDTNRIPRRVTSVEGNFEATARRLNIDNNGFAPIEWGSWQTTWTGVASWTNSWREGNIPIRDVWATTTTSTSGQARTGIRTRVLPRVDEQSLGDTLLSSTSVPWIRSRNIAFTAERMKPRTRLHAFFDGILIDNYITPKVIELVKNSGQDIRTNETPFVIGETVVGQTSRCRLLVTPPNDGVVKNPYSLTEEDLPESYASQTSVLNIDTVRLSETISPNYFGNVAIGEILVGLTSGARAVVKDRRLITDNVGSISGTFFIPSPALDSNPRWATGTRTLRFTTSLTDSRVPGTVDTSAETEYIASGTLNTVQENVLAIRNASMVRDTVSDSRVISSTRTEVRVGGWYDPLAQSFISDEPGGVFLTGVDVYFATKDSNVPISMQVRTMENGYPSKIILPFSDITLTPDQIEISDNAAIPTRFRFKAPVYIKQSEEHCFVLLSDSNEYRVWISRMGDIDVSGNRTISEQPYAGVLFKSQNASTWTADQYEDLKFSMYRAKFNTNTGSVIFNNSELGIGNGGIAKLAENSIRTINPKRVINLPTGNTYSYTIGARLIQEPSNAEATVVSFSTLGANNTITITDITGTWAAGFVQGDGAIFQNIKSSQSLATVVLSTIQNGTFAIGDVITGSNSGTTGVVTSYTSGTLTLELNYMNGEFDSSDTLSNESGVSATISSDTYSGDSVNGYPASAPTARVEDKAIIVSHNNHCMHSRQNNVEISGVISEVPATVLTADLNIGSNSITVQDATAFHKVINAQAIGNLNPGYIKINNEIIQYSAISTNGQIITVATSGRAAAGTSESNHPSGSVVECYNLDGIPLIEINKVHTAIENPTLDQYLLSTNSVASIGILGGGDNIYATQNVQFELLTPRIATLNFPETNITARVNTTRGTSIGDGTSIIDQASFVNTGEYDDVVLNDTNYFSNPKLICSKVNEDNKLSGDKSMTLNIILTTTKDTLSPIIDLDRTSIITTTNRINNWVGGGTGDAGYGYGDPFGDTSTDPYGDQNEAIYITKPAKLLSPSKSIKVDFAADRSPQNEIKVYYKAYLASGTTNPNQIKWVEMNPPEGKNNPSPSETVNSFKDYEFFANNLTFDTYQIKIVMTSTNQAIVPQVKEFRSIALAS
jgi:Domain of unknown function (DUF4815)